MTTDIAVVDSFDDDGDDDIAAAFASTVSIQCRAHLCVWCQNHTPDVICTFMRMRMAGNR